MFEQIVALIFHTLLIIIAFSLIETLHFLAEYLRVKTKRLTIKSVCDECFEAIEAIKKDKE